VNELDAYLSCLKRLDFRRTDDVLIIDLGEQKLGHYRGPALLASYPVSSGRRARSCVADSLGTPWGLHGVAAKHGAGAPAGMVFKGRRATGARWQEMVGAGPRQGSLVTTRILRLRGLEPGLNAGHGIDSFARFIYIHGTNQPQRFPENISSGCVLMRDPDLIELFDAVPAGAHVWLSHPPAPARIAMDR
jgi:hypothetical protein